MPLASKREGDDEDGSGKSSEKGCIEDKVHSEHAHGERNIGITAHAILRLQAHIGTLRYTVPPRGGYGSSTVQ
ncbi:MAG: hypothetical protein RhofKO_06470 [Rhodothermales bacterium]